MTKPRTVDEVTETARRVIAGKLDAGHLVEAMCRQHLVDLKGRKDLRWDVEAADKGIRLVCLGLHEELLSPLEQFLVGSIFGWRSADGVRRIGLTHERA